LTTLRYDFDGMMETLTAKVIEGVESPFSEHFERVYRGKIVVRVSCPKAEPVRNSGVIC
jgi:hypothetical protein